MSNYKSEDLTRIAEILKALSNQHRLAIYERLVECCTPGLCCPGEDAANCVGDLAEGLDIAPSTVSHHVKELRNAGLIGVKRQGKEVHCWAEADTLLKLSEFFKDLIMSGRSRGDQPA